MPRQSRTSALAATTIAALDTEDAAYGRVSTREQEEEGVSLELQRERCEAAAKAAGRPAPRWYADPGLSGGRADNRPQLQELLRRVRAGQIGTIYVYRLDRLSRSAFDGIHIIKDLIDHNVRLVSVSEGVDLGSAMGRMIVMIMLIIAQWFLDSLHENVRGALAYIQRGGRWIGGSVYGYRHPGDGQPLVIEPSEAEVVRRIYDEYNSGAMIINIARGLNGDHIPTRHDKRWQTNTVRLILSRRLYCGEFEARDGIVYEGVHEAIITREQWRQAQERLERNAKLHPRQRQSTLAPAFCCGYCGVRLSYHTNGVSSTYLCMARFYHPGTDRHPPCNMSPRLAEGITWRVVEWIITDGVLARWQQQTREARRRDGTQSKRAKLQREKGSIEGKLHANATAYGEQAITLSVLLDLNRPLMDRLQQVEAELQQMAAGQPPDVGALLSDEFLRRVRSAGVEEQRDFLAALFDRIELNRDGLTYVPRFPGAAPIIVPRPRHKCPPDEWFTPPQE